MAKPRPSIVVVYTYAQPSFYASLPAVNNNINEEKKK